MAICKTCNKNHHVCFSCGVEEFLYDYCSTKCLEADGKIICPVCKGWGTSSHEDTEEYKNNEDFSCPGYMEKKLE